LPVIALTQGIVSASSSATRKTVLRDQRCNGLSLEVRQTGGKTWYCTYSTREGRRCSLRLGSAQEVPLAAARQACQETRLQATLGHNLAADWRRRRCELTLEAFAIDHYLPVIAQLKLSWRDDLGILHQRLLPSLGRLRLSEISTEHLLQFRRGLLHDQLAPGTINRYMATLRHLFSVARREGLLRRSNKPWAGLQPLPDRSRPHSCLTQEQWLTLARELQCSRNRHLFSICLLLLCTGARKREALDARWCDVDLEHGRWTIPRTKSGHSLTVPLSEPALILLQRLQGHQQRLSPWVFPNPRTGVPYRSIFSAWDVARRAAGLAHLRVHDLRHSFATVLVNQGAPLYTVQALLGHAYPRITQRYARMQDEALKAASELAGDWYGITLASSETS